MNDKWIKAIPPKMLHEKLGVYVGQWTPEMDRCWIRKEDGVCVSSRLIRTDFGLIEHVTLTRSVSEAVKGNYGFSWAEKQEIKNELFGEDRFAIEVYPKERKLVDSADVYHLWVFDKKKEMPFGIHPKEYTKAVNRGYSMTEDELKVLKAYYDDKGK